MHVRMLTSIVVCLFSIGSAAAQPPGGGGRSFGFDPGQIFDSWDRNKDGVVTRDEITDRRGQDRFDDYVRRANVTDGRLTREVFLKAFQARMDERMRNPFGSPDTLFRQYDRNNDGKLDKDEIQQTTRLRPEWEKWDKNKDGAIDLQEYTSFMEDVTKRGGFGGGFGPFGASVTTTPLSSSTTPAEKKPDEPKPAEPAKPAEPIVVYRAGKLPPGMPSWFTELDKDNDGQVGLHEWKGRPLSEFATIDRNGDGIITIDEALRHEAAKNAKPVKPDEEPPIIFRSRSDQ